MGACNGTSLATVTGSPIPSNTSTNNISARERTRAKQVAEMHNWCITCSKKQYFAYLKWCYFSWRWFSPRTTYPTADTPFILKIFSVSPHLFLCLLFVNKKSADWGETFWCVNKKWCDKVQSLICYSMCNI